jgi:DNA repair protein RecO (recombination protein O)
MPARLSEAIILRTYPLKEADLIVSFFTRDQGRLRGVAKRARRPKSGFGSTLERLSQVNVSYFQRENRELVSLDSCELIRSQFGLLSNYEAGVALDYLAEISEQLLPASEPSERHFRLLVAVLDHMRSGAPGAVWRAVVYFLLWAVRLAGFLPELEAARVSPESKALAAEMLRSPVSAVAPGEWSKKTAADLRKYLVRLIESQIERKLLAAPAFEAA